MLFKFKSITPINGCHLSQLVPSTLPVQNSETPCVGLCSTVYGDLVCRGCKRFHHEIVQWNALTLEQRDAVWHRLGSLLIPLVRNYFIIIDANLLKQQMTRFGIKFREKAPAELWVYQLLIRGGSRIRNLNKYGLVMCDGVDMSPKDIRDHLDRAFFILSEAHFHRYLLPSNISLQNVTET